MTEHERTALYAWIDTGVTIDRATATFRDLIEQVWGACCTVKNRQHAAEIAEAREIISQLSGQVGASMLVVSDYDYCEEVNRLRGLAESWLNAHPEED